MAVGAQRETVHRMVMREASGLTGMGLAAGLVCAVGAGALMRSFSVRRGGLRCRDVGWRVGCGGELCVAGELLTGAASSQRESS